MPRQKSKTGLEIKIRDGGNTTKGGRTTTALIFQKNSEIMNAYKHPISGYKSPVKKLSTAGSKLASAAAHRGSMIIDSASSAVQNARSPQKHHQQHHHNTPAKKRSSAGIRDRINKFDSACRSTVSPAPYRGTRVYVANANQSNPKSYPFNPNFRPDPTNSGEKNISKQLDSETFDSLEQQMDKENAANFASPTKTVKQSQAAQIAGTLDGNKRMAQEHRDEDYAKDFTSSSRHRKMKHKLQTENAAKAIQKVKDVFSPVTVRGESTVQTVKEVFSLVKKHGNQESASTEQKERGILSPPLEAINATTDSSASYPITVSDANLDLIRRLEQLERENEMLEIKNQSLEQKCEELVIKNKGLEASQTYADKNDNKVIKSKNNKEKGISKRRCSNEHPLIATPLRKHAHVVQEASETNSFVSVRKDPFPLFPPSQGTNKNAVVNNDHLDELGVLTGNNMQHRHAPSIDDGNAREKRKNEEAIDLLNSAAFLFKTSRRRLN